MADSIDFFNDIGLWIKSNRLPLNSSKTEFVWLLTSHRLHYFNDSPLIIGSTIVKLTTMATKVSTNVGILMNQDFSMKPHIGKLVQSCFYLRQIQAICWSLTLDAAKTVICSLIHYCVDCCNCLLSILSAYTFDCMQSILNTTTHLVCGLCKLDQWPLTTVCNGCQCNKALPTNLCLLTLKGLHMWWGASIYQQVVQACLSYRLLSQIVFHCHWPAYHSPNPNRVWKESILIFWTVSLEQPASQCKTVYHNFVLRC